MRSSYVREIYLIPISTYLSRRISIFLIARGLQATKYIRSPSSLLWILPGQPCVQPRTPPCLSGRSYFVFIQGEPRRTGCAKSKRFLLMETRVRGQRWQHYPHQARNITQQMGCQAGKSLGGVCCDGYTYCPGTTPLHVTFVVDAYDGRCKATKRSRQLKPHDPNGSTRYFLLRWN